MTWTLCSVAEPRRVLAEVRRVLRPGGTFLFVEHTRSHQRAARWAQRRLTPTWSRFAGGCHLDRDAVGLIEQAGFTDVRVRPYGRERFTLFPVYGGRAVAAR